MKLLIDPRQSGISGDMLIASLTDFFDCHTYTNSVLESICKTAESMFGLQCNYKVEKTTINHFSGSKLFFSVEKDFEHLNILEFKEKWLRLLEKIGVTSSLRERVFEILGRIIETEQSVHGLLDQPLEKIHFHELNSIDTIIDITVTVAILEHQQITSVTGLPTAIGTGTITFSHGTFQQPAPAVAKLLEITSYPMVSRDLEFELTTPTGLTILTTLIGKNKPLINMPTGIISKSGIGFGQKQLPKYANFLRIWSLEETSFDTDAMIIIETHVDDASGELLGNIIESYSQIKGIMDASVYPLIMKKNRPGNCIRLLVDPEIMNLDEISFKLMKDSGSLGVRHYPVSRHKSVREIQERKITLGNENYTVRIKISKINDEIIAIKPEYDDIKAICLKTQKSFKEIQDAVLSQMNKTN